MITLLQINNDYFLNGVKGDYSNFNMDGKYKQISYTIWIDKQNRTCKEWLFN